MSGTITSRTVAHSRTEMTELVLPQHANALGTIFGGQVMAWIDICAAVAAQRHCGRIAVTAAVDELVRTGRIARGQKAREKNNGKQLSHG